MAYSLINPTVDMEKKPMSELPKNVQSRLCKCEPRCTDYINLDGYGRYCLQDALTIAHGLFALVNGINRIPNINADKYREWTYQEEQVIQDFLRSKDRAEWGDYRFLGSLLNRTHESIKSRVKLLRREGRL